MTSLRLPLLVPHDSALQKCVYCPKLSRAACPVSTVTASETLTPWGKMSMAYFMGRGDVPVDADHGGTAWACSACMGCRERCDHKNDVASALVDARAEVYARGAAPEPARRVAQGFADHARRTADATRRLQPKDVAGTRSDVAVLVGCAYVNHLPDVAEQAVAVLDELLGGRSLRLVHACCGLGLRYAGDRASLARAAEALGAEVQGAEEVVAVDPGCARTLLETYPTLGVTLPTVRPFVDVVAASLPARLAGRAAGPPRVVRYHDPCMLGRGLGRYDEPRAIVAAATGAPPLEFQRAKNEAECSGGGGLMPITLPDVSRRMTDERLADHEGRGGGEIVTACAGSLRRFRASGARAVDLVTLVADALSRVP